MKLLKAIKKYSSVERKIAVINDTTAVLLGGITLDKNEICEKYVGAIYGTGFNCCYIEDNKNILKIKDLPSGNMIINAETGNFNGFNRGIFDNILTNESQLPNEALTEKMSSGKYLANLIYKVTKCAIENGIISKDTKLPEYNDFTLPLVSMNLANVNDELKKCFVCSEDYDKFEQICYELINDEHQAINLLLEKAFKNHIPVWKSVPDLRKWNRKAS